MGMEGISKPRASRLSGEIDERVHALLARPIEGNWPYIWLDATHVEVRRDHQIVSVALMDEAEADVLAYMRFPLPHRVKPHSTNPLERLSGETTRRSGVVGIFPDEAAVTRLIGALPLEQNGERRCSAPAT
jgi:transposase-like protein